MVFLIVKQERRALDTQTFDIGEWKRLPSSEETAIGSAMESAIRAIGEQPLSAVVLLSDGGQHAYPPNDLPPQAESRRLGERGVFRFGQLHSASPEVLRRQKMRQL